jgi:hypothetical protein
VHIEGHRLIFAGGRLDLGLSVLADVVASPNRPSGGPVTQDRRPRSLPLLDGNSEGAPLRAQILATEHWSLLATRSITWNEIFSRTGTFLTVLSASVVALSLVAQATDFGQDFRVFSLLVLPIVLALGLGTYVRLVEADIEDAWLVVGMNRLRHAYLELAPELEPYFVTAHHDDELGLLQTYSFRTNVGVTHLLSGSPVIIGIVDTVIAAVIAVVVCQGLGAAVGLQVVVGLVVAFAALAALGSLGYRKIRQVRSIYRPRFPS